MKPCDECKIKRDADNEKTVPWSAVELLNESHSTDKRRAWVLAVVLIIALFASNAIWLYFWNQYEYVTETDVRTYTQDGQGINIIGNDNEAEQNEPAVSNSPYDTNP